MDSESGTPCLIFAVAPSSLSSTYLFIMECDVISKESVKDTPDANNVDKVLVNREANILPYSFPIIGIFVLNLSKPSLPFSVLRNIQNRTAMTATIATIRPE